MKLTKTFDKKIDVFYERFSQGKDVFREAGKMLVDLVDENPNAFELILKRHPDVPPSALELVERIGRGKLLLEIALSERRVAQLALSRSLPVKDQKQLVDGLVPVVEEIEGGTRVVQKRMEEIKFIEAARVIGEGRINPVDEQQRLINAERERRAVAMNRYRILGDRVVFNSRHPFTWSELDYVLQQIAPKANELENAMKANQIRK